MKYEPSKFADSFRAVFEDARGQRLEVTYFSDDTSFTTNFGDFSETLQDKLVDEFAAPGFTVTIV